MNDSDRTTKAEKVVFCVLDRGGGEPAGFGGLEVKITECKGHLKRVRRQTRSAPLVGFGLQGFRTSKGA